MKTPLPSHNAHHGSWRSSAWWYSKIVGHYDYSYLLMPQWPWCGARRKTNKALVQFFPTEERLSLLLTLLMGFQHAMVMMVGLVLAPLSVGAMAPAGSGIPTYLVSANLIVSGISTFVQVYSIPIWPKHGIRLGSGILSVMGTTGTFIAITTNIINKQMENGATFEEAYGGFLGAVAVVSPLPMLASFVPPKALQRVFPRFLVGTVLVLIGTSLVGTSFEYWGGGTGCYNNPDALCVNGNVQLPFGSPQYVGLGFVTFVTIVLCELFGSPLMRSASIVIGLVVGYIVACLTRWQGAAYVTIAPIQAAPWITFLWTTTFPLSVWPAAILPCCVGILINIFEGIGDITGTEETAMLDTEGPAHDQRIAGGLLNDGFSTLLSALSGAMPTSNYGRNNGVIAVTRCASRSAGYAAACLLLLAGIVGKFAGWILTIPPCVLGGCVAFLFATLVVVGFKISRFIVASMLMFGLGVTVVPAWATPNLWPSLPADASFIGSLQDTVIIILTTGFALGAIVGILLHALMPQESSVAYIQADIAHLQRQLEAAQGAGAPTEQGHRDQARVYIEESNTSATCRSGDKSVQMASIVGSSSMGSVVGGAMTAAAGTAAAPASDGHQLVEVNLMGEQQP